MFVTGLFVVKIIEEGIGRFCGREEEEYVCLCIIIEHYKEIDDSPYSWCFFRNVRRTHLATSVSSASNLEAAFAEHQS
ncbi:hypothetical protein KIN20_027884, partial [Parelaphostrongylus tenuis]